MTQEKECGIKLYKNKIVLLSRTGKKNYKQSLYEVFVIFGIIKVEVSVISRAEGRG